MVKKPKKPSTKIQVKDLDTKKNPKGGDEPPLEEVTFTFKKIEVQNTTAKSAAISSWEKPQS